MIHVKRVAPTPGTGMRHPCPRARAIGIRRTGCRHLTLAPLGGAFDIRPTGCRHPAPARGGLPARARRADRSWRCFPHPALLPLASARGPGRRPMWSGRAREAHPRRDAPGRGVPSRRRTARSARPRRVVAPARPTRRPALDPGPPPGGVLRGACPVGSAVPRGERTPLRRFPRLVRLLSRHLAPRDALACRAVVLRRARCPENRRPTRHGTGVAPSVADLPL